MKYVPIVLVILVLATIGLATQSPFNPGETARFDTVNTNVTTNTSAIGSLDATPSNYTPDSSAAVIADHLKGVDTALASMGATEFADDVFRVQDNGDATKEVAIQASGITTGTVRTITMPDADVDLGALALTDLSNLVNPTLINQDLDHDGTNVRSLGSGTSVWSSLWTRGIIITNYATGSGLNLYLMEDQFDLPSGVEVAGISMQTTSDKPLGIATEDDNAADTKDIYIETGDMTSGANTSGFINIRTGQTNTGVGGNISLITPVPTDGAGTQADIILDARKVIVVDGGIQLDFITADPCGDALAFPEGGLWYNDTSDYPCFCDGGGVDLKMDGSTACF